MNAGANLSKEQKRLMTFCGNLLKGIPPMSQERVEYWNNHLEVLHKGLVYLADEENKVGVEDWIETILASERKVHLDFFGAEFDLTLFSQTLREIGQEKISFWKSLNLEVHFLPKTIFSPETDLPGWKIKPENWYWQKLNEGKILNCNGQGNLEKVKTAELLGNVVLVDTRLKPRYQEGKQMFQEDKKFLGSIIAQLRKEGKLAEYEHGPQTSRFGISSKEWDNHLRLAIAQFLGLETAQVRLETALEANIIPQLFKNMPRTKDGTTNTWVWYEEFFEDATYRLHGGNSVHGGLADVYYYGVSHHWHYRSVRPLGVLA